MDAFLGLKFPAQERAEGGSLVAPETHAQERAWGCPSICAVPGQVLEGPQILSMWEEDSSTAAVDSGVSQFPWPVSAVYLTLSTPCPTQMQAPEPA